MLPSNPFWNMNSLSFFHDKVLWQQQSNTQLKLTNLTQSGAPALDPQAEILVSSNYSLVSSNYKQEFILQK